MSKEKSRGHREAKKPKANKKTTAATPNSFLRVPPSSPKPAKEAAKE
jgi:hypothetical protein